MWIVTQIGFQDVDVALSLLAVEAVAAAAPRALSLPTDCLLGIQCSVCVAAPWAKCATSIAQTILFGS